MTANTDRQPLQTPWYISLAVFTGVYLSYQYFGFELTVVYLLAIISLVGAEIVEQQRHE